MAIDSINVGSAANDGTGDTLREAFEKVNANNSYLEGLANDAQDTADAAIPATEKGAAEGVATLDADSRVPQVQLVRTGSAVEFGNGHGTTASEGTAVGSAAQATQASGSAFGYSAGYENSGAHQSAFGYYAGYLNSGAHQSAFGYYAGRQNSGDHQSAFGYSAGRLNSGAHQSAFGYFAGYENSGAYQVALGSEAGRGNTRDNRLIIHSSVSADLTTPLIDGRFTAGTDAGDSFAYVKGVKVNGLLEATDSLVLTSPDGTRYKVTVANGGTLTVASTTEEITP
jgi:hypothetical protein